MRITAAVSEYEALVHAIHRLSLRFPGVPEDDIRATVAEELVEFDDRAMRQYVPVLVEGRTLRRLRAAHRDGEPGAVRYAWGERGLRPPTLERRC